jgi:hypothetical protein
VNLGSLDHYLIKETVLQSLVLEAESLLDSLLTQDFLVLQLTKYLSLTGANHQLDILEWPCTAEPLRQIA